MCEWWKRAKAVAYGPLSLHPDEFYSISPLDLWEMSEGYEWREKKEDEKKAFWVSCMMNVHLKRGVKPSDLLKVLYPEEEKEKDRAEFFSQFEEVLDNGDNS